jgi:hypothetical protein
MPTFSGRVEARMTVPASTTVSASTGAHSTAVTVTVDAGNYYLSEAGGVDSLIDTLETELNENVQGYPLTADATKVACGGLPTWSAGWLFNITSGNDGGAFGGVTMTAVSTPVYSNAGPQGGIDLAVSFDSALDAFSAGDNFDPLANDLVIAVVAKVSTDTNGDIIGKGWGGDGFLFVTEAGGNLRLYVKEGADTIGNQATGLPTDTWFVAMGVLERATSRLRCGWRALDGSSSAVSSEADSTAIGSIDAAGAFTVGASSGYGIHAGLQVAAVYIGAGSGFATGVSTSLATVLTNLAAAISSEWTVTTSTSTGLTTITNSWWPAAIDFTSTDLRDLLGFTIDVDYPQNVTEMTTALGGYSTMSAGFLCNEASGDLLPAFGSFQMADTGTTTYSIQGARGGTDKAVALGAASDTFSGGDVLDVTASDDLVLVWVGKWTSAATRDVFHKFAGAAGWAIYSPTTSSIGLLLNDGVDQVVPIAAALPVNEWYVGIAAVDRTANTARIGVRTLATNTTTLSADTSIATIGNMSNAASLLMGCNASINNNGTGHQVSAWYIGVGSGIAFGIPANLSAILSSFATYMKSQTGTEQARGLFFPDCPINLSTHPSQAPRVTDLRQSEGPTGVVLGLAGNSKYRHRGLIWSHVPSTQVWESEATYTNGSWQTFLDDTQFGMGHSWFTPSSRVQIYWQNGANTELLGSALNDGDGTAGWFLKGLTSCEPPLSVPPYTGLYRIEIPEIVSDG